MARSCAVLLVAVLLGGCRLTLNTTNTNDNTSTGTGTGTGGGGGGNGGGSPTGPSPTPAPTPTPAPGGRTTDPSPGVVLPLPSYAESVVSSVPFVAANTCLSFTYLDTVVDRLRAQDTRWGYACGSSGCSTASLDKLAYHALAGPEATGVLGNWIIDVIRDVCGGNAGPFFSAGYEANTGWTSRGRF